MTRGTCTDIVPSNCVPYNGPNIPCLGLCKGDSVSDIIIKLATKVCDAIKPTDLTGIDLTCVYTIIGNGPETGTRSDITVITALSTAICTIENSVQTLANSLGTLNTWQVNSTITIPTDGSAYDVSILSNIGINQAFGVWTPFTRDDIIQDTIKYIGTLNIEITGISNTIGAYNQTISNLQTQWANYQPPLLIADIQCLTSYPGILGGPQDVVTAISNISTAFCDYMSHAGSVTDVQTAMSRMPTAIQTYYLGKSITGWVQTPSSLAQLTNNYELIINDLYNRITTIENTCCASTCSDIKIGYSIDFIGSNMVIYFRTIDGTDIPVGYTDAGSVMTIVDDTTGHTVTAPLVITNNYQTAPIPLTGFTPNGNITFSLLYSMSNGTLTCSNNIATTVKYSGGCAYCTITVSSGT